MFFFGGAHIHRLTASPDYGVLRAFGAVHAPLAPLPVGLHFFCKNCATIVSMKNLLELFLHDTTNILIFGIIIFIFTVLIAWSAGRISAEIKFRRLLKTERADAVNRSKAVLSGLAAEQLAPFLPDFPCSPSDCRFVGKPIDFVAFSGAGEGEIKEIVFIEVKTGTSQLTKREQELKNCILQGKVRWQEYRVNPHLK